MLASGSEHTNTSPYKQPVQVDKVWQLLHDVEEPAWIIEKHLDDFVAAASAKVSCQLLQLELEHIATARGHAGCTWSSSDTWAAASAA